MVLSVRATNFTLKGTTEVVRSSVDLLESVRNYAYIWIFGT